MRSKQLKSAEVFSGGNSQSFSNTVSSLSRYVHGTILKFCAEETDSSFHLISVVDNRDISLFVEKHTGVQHEAPQLLALRNGTVFAHASHWYITPMFVKKVQESLRAALERRA